MNIWEILKISLLDLSLHKFRSTLAAVGIIFGVAAVEGMLSISEGARVESIRQISLLGVNNIIIRSVKPSKADAADAKNKDSNRPLNRSVAEYGVLRLDLRHVLETFPMVQNVVGVRNMRQNIYTGDGTAADLQVLATEPQYIDVMRSEITRGRFLSFLDESECRLVCVLGTDAARKLAGFEDPLEQRVRIAGDWYKVVGVLNNPSGVKTASGYNLNNCIYIPLATARARYGDLSVQTSAGSREVVRIQLDELLLQMADTAAIVPTARRLENYFSKTHSAKDFELVVPLELIRQKEQTQKIFGIVMFSIASISLLVGGIGVMNIMLANVSDRRKEIGTRRAIGARKKDILYQFVFEAATLTSLGGIAGVVVGLGLAKAVSFYANWPTILTPTGIILGLSVSCGVGIIFGLWPAYQAASVNPIEALRSD